ncbi:MAG: HAMP domain-containing protein [Acidobacteria bacterium]|nr:MAG: HAMP domain-containing protein [Acidobacteriota bacterium]
MLGYRVRLMLALALAGGLPPVVFLWAARPQVELLRKGLAREARLRAQEGVRDRVTAWERETAARLADWCRAAGAPVGRLLEAAGEPRTGRRVRLALAEVRDAARAAGIDAGAIFDPEGRPLLAWGRYGGASAGRNPSWSFLPSEGVLLELAEPCPPGRPQALRLAAVRRFPAAEFERALAVAAGGPVVVGSVLPGRHPTAPDRALLTLPSAEGRPAVGIEIGLENAGAAPARRLVRGLRWAAVATAIAAAGVGLFAGYSLSRPLARLTREVTRRADGAPDRSPLPGGPGEVGELAAAVDRLVARLDREQLRRMRAERMAAWREIARRVAHEVRNPLTPIRLAMDNLRRLRRRDPSKLPEHVEEEAASVLEEVSRLERLVREFAEFARLPEPRLRPVDVAAVAQGAAAGQIPSGGPIRLEVSVAGSLPPVAGDPDLLGMAVANVARNAVEALGGGSGRIRLTVRPLEREPVDGTPGTLVEVAVEDDGPGLPPDIAGRIFDPYVTGRAGDGTGLGLAIVRWIVRGHGGLVRAGPGSLGGARIAILLPAHGPPLAEEGSGGPEWREC